MKTSQIHNFKMVKRGFPSFPLKKGMITIKSKKFISFIFVMIFVVSFWAINTLVNREKLNINEIVIEINKTLGLNIVSDSAIITDVQEKSFIFVGESPNQTIYLIKIKNNGLKKIDILWTDSISPSKDPDLMWSYSDIEKNKSIFAGVIKNKNIETVELSGPDLANLNIKYIDYNDRKIFYTIINSKIKSPIVNITGKSKNGSVVYQK